MTGRTERSLIRTWDEFVRILPPDLMALLEGTNGEKARVIEFFKIRVGLRDGNPNSQQAFEE